MSTWVYNNNISIGGGLAVAGTASVTGQSTLQGIITLSGTTYTLSAAAAAVAVVDSLNTAAVTYFDAFYTGTFPTIIPRNTSVTIAGFSHSNNNGTFLVENNSKVTDVLNTTIVSNASGGNTTYTGGDSLHHPNFSDFSYLYPGSKVTISGFSNPNNNGTFSVVSSSGTQVVVNNPSGVIATTTSATYVYYTLTASNYATITPETNNSATATWHTTSYTGTFNPTLVPGTLANIVGFTNAGNNGTFPVVSCTSTTLVVSNPNGVSESAAAHVQLPAMLGNYGSMTLSVTPTVPSTQTWTYQVLALVNGYVVASALTTITNGQATLGGGNGNNNLSWSAVPGAQQYLVIAYLTPGEGEGVLAVVAPPTTTYSDTGASTPNNIVYPNTTGYIVAPNGVVAGPPVYSLPPYAVPLPYSADSTIFAVSTETPNAGYFTTIVDSQNLGAVQFSTATGVTGVVVALDNSIGNSYVTAYGVQGIAYGHQNANSQIICGVSGAASGDSPGLTNCIGVLANAAYTGNSVNKNFEISGLAVLSSGNLAVPSGVYGGGVASYGYGIFVGSTLGCVNNYGVYIAQDPGTGYALWSDGDNYLGAGGGYTVFGTNAPVTTNVIVDIRSTSQAFAPPRMSTTQKNAITSPSAGMVVYDTTQNALNTYNGTAWIPLAGIVATGTALTTGSVSLSGWGSGATVTSVSGYNGAFSVTITAGTTPSANPTFTVTYTSTWPNTPVVVGQQIGGTGVASFTQIAPSTTIATFTWIGTPSSGDTYIFNAITVGI